MVSVNAVIILSLLIAPLSIVGIWFFVFRKVSRQMAEMKKILDSARLDFSKSLDLANSKAIDIISLFSQAVKEQPEKIIDLIRFYLAQEDSENRLKLAVFLVAIGPELSTEVYKFLREDEIETLTFSVARLKAVDNERTTAILKEFYETYKANQSVLKGGLDYARELLVRSLGYEKTNDIINRLTASLEVRTFDYIRRSDPEHILNFIQQEHPQIIALILAYFEPEKAAILLRGLPPELQGEVTRRVATIDRVSPEVLRDIERVLEEKLSAFFSEDYKSVGGLEAAVEILNRVGRASEKQIIGVLKDKDPELADAIKKRMFVFEDIVALDDSAIQKVAREADSRELAMALKNADAEIRDKILRNMPKRAARTLKKRFIDPARLKDVEDAQQNIVLITRRLEDAGEIVIPRAGENRLVV